MCVTTLILNRDLTTITITYVSNLHTQQKYLVLVTEIKTNCNSNPYGVLCSIPCFFVYLRMRMSTSKHLSTNNT